MIESFQEISPEVSHEVGALSFTDCRHGIVLSCGGRLRRKKEFVASVDADGIQKVEVLVGGYFFDPDHIIVTVNVPVEIRIRKEASATPYTFALRAPDAGMDINESLSTEPKRITFRPTKPGKYPFYCDKKLLFFKSHRDRGMEGVLEVRD